MNCRYMIQSHHSQTEHLQHICHNSVTLLQTSGDISSKNVHICSVNIFKKVITAAHFHMYVNYPVKLANVSSAFFSIFKERYIGNKNCFHYNCHIIVIITVVIVIITIIIIITVRRLFEFPWVIYMVFTCHKTPTQRTQNRKNSLHVQRN